MKQAFLDRFGTIGAVVAAAACPICFPKLALIGAAVGLGAFAPHERYIAIVVQVLFVLAFIGQVLAFRRHRNRLLPALSTLTTALLFVGYLRAAIQHPAASFIGWSGCSQYLACL